MNIISALNAEALGQVESFEFEILCKYGFRNVKTKKKKQKKHSRRRSLVIKDEIIQVLFQDAFAFGDIFSINVQNLD
jgi:hypothetical protein